MPEERSQPNQKTVLLLCQCKEGDPAAFDELITRFYPVVYRMVRARMGALLARKEGIEDLVQDTFLQVLRGLETYEVRADAHFIAYLAKVAHTTVVNKIEYYAAGKRDAKRELPIEEMRKAVNDSSFGGQLLRDTPSPATKVSAREMEEIVDTCVSLLEEAQREVILLRDYAGADWALIASELGRTIGASQQLHRRARVKLTELVRAVR